MVRKYKRRSSKGTYKETDIKKAIDLIAKGDSIRKVTDRYSVKRETLRHKIKIIKSPGVEFELTSNYSYQNVFTDVQENSIADYLKMCCKMFYGLTTKDCRKLTYETTVANEIKCAASWVEKKIAGEDWLLGFFKRHPNLSLQFPEGCSLARAIKHYLKKEPRLGDPSRIYNLDKTKTTTAQNNGKIIAEKSSKTVCNSLGLATPSGCINTQLFVQIMQHFIKFSYSTKDNPSLLIYDNYESYISLDVFELAKANGVHILLALVKEFQERDSGWAYYNKFNGERESTYKSLDIAKKYFYEKKRVLFVVYVDLDCTLEKIDRNPESFVEELRQLAHSIQSMMISANVPMADFTRDDWDKFNKVRNHCHLTARYRGVMFHNLSDYDAQFIIKEITTAYEGRVDLLPTTKDSYRFASYLDGEYSDLPELVSQQVRADQFALDSPTGYILEVDMEYPQHFHSAQIDLSFCPMREKPPGRREDKLLTTLCDQSPWLCEYIELNTKFRTLVKNDFEKNLYKLINNAIIGKTIENEHDCVNVRLLTKCEGRYGMEAATAKLP
ncbi:hypothetical protein ALC56_04009 [Trachymyrmex septentrionalis]|uniref:HTH psq-type domain-containing protein n=1 Tax=Trachymyrmex septentrionalis TaxID=34720 RepID=A0A151JZE0_9HYME|nr:hypothetical protein ALC56_04009 [Trachymyrmex septentrionalis]